MKSIVKKGNFNIFLIYLGLIAIIYAQVIFFGKSLLPFLYHPLEQYGISDVSKRKPINVFNIDLACPAFEIIPTNKLVGDIYKEGRLPLWNPYQGCGVPLAAQYSTRVFFPYQILENVFPSWSWDYFMLVRLIVAGFFTFLFLSALGASRLSSFLGGIFYMFSGSMVWFINAEQFVNVAMTIPVLFFSFEKMIEHRKRFFWGVSSIAIALVLLAGQPEIAIYVILLATAYYFLRIFGSKKFRLGPFIKDILIFIFVIILGLGIAAVLISPFLEYIPYSYNCHPFGGKSGIRSPALLGYYINFFIPSLFQIPTYYRNLPHNGVWDYLGGYSGILALYLLSLGVFFKNQYRKYVIFFGVCGLLIILKNFNFPVVSALGYLPLLNQAWSPRWAGPAWTFSFACAGALGLEIILTAQEIKRNICWPIILGILLIVLIYYPLAPVWLKSEEFVAITGLNLQNFHTILPFFLLGTAVTGIILVITGILITYYRRKKNFQLTIILLGILELWFLIPRGMEFEWELFKLVPFIIGIFSLFTLLKEKYFLTSFFIFSAVFLAIFIDCRSPKGFPERRNVFFEKPYIRFLKSQEGNFRIMGAKGILMPNFSGAFGIFDVRYIDALSPATYQNYADKHLLKFPYVNDTDRLWFTGISERNRGMYPSIYRAIIDNRIYYSFLGVKYILAPSNSSFGLPIVYDKEIKIYENPLCLSRVFIAHEIEYASSFAEAQEKIRGLGIDLQKKIILEEKIPQKYNSFGLADSSKAIIKEYHPDQVIIKADLENPGVLVLTDVFYPGWQAFVDNRQVKIYRVNGLVRGVLLEGGNHTVIFKYFPQSFTAGLIISTLCFIFSIGLMIKKPKSFIG